MGKCSRCRCRFELTFAAHYCAFCGLPVSAEGLFSYLVGIKEYSDLELDTLAEQLRPEKRSISKHRRIVHGALDMVRAEKVRRLRDSYQDAPAD